MSEFEKFPLEELCADFCVVGGGMAGFVMALTCARMP